jgi:superfamily I DNA/RNA helicase
VKATDEQVAAVDAALSGQSFAVEALAGTGKTSTLVLVARAMTQRRRRGTYLAFNKAIVKDAGDRFPAFVNAATIHSFAYKAVGYQYRHRIGGDRIPSSEIARMLDLKALTLETKMARKRLAPGFLAGVVMRGLREFAKTGAADIGAEHIPPPNTMRDDKDLLAAWEHVQEALAPKLTEAWDDVMDPNGTLPYDMSYYLKAWQLSGPTIATDYLMVDEAQDLNGCMIAIAEAQRDHSQLVVIGDRHQQIYEWNGSVNAMDRIAVEGRTTLTASWRFGPQIAEVANDVLDILGAGIHVTGRGQPGTVAPLEHPDVVLTRTNTMSVRLALDELADGGAPHIVGGADDVIGFAKGALDLQAGKSTYHRDLAMFETWDQVRAYCEQDELGRDLRTIVDLIDDFGADIVVDVLNRQPSEHDATVILSTAHKAKGREWWAVKLAADFPEDLDDVATEELRLLYVAATRAQAKLDTSEVGIFDQLTIHPAELDRIAATLGEP